MTMDRVAALVSPPRVLGEVFRVGEGKNTQLCSVPISFSGIVYVGFEIRYISVTFSVKIGSIKIDGKLL